VSAVSAPSEMAEDRGDVLNAKRFGGERGVPPAPVTFRRPISLSDPASPTRTLPTNRVHQAKNRPPDNRARDPIADRATAALIDR
jgi:hypothetical protein